MTDIVRIIKENENYLRIEADIGVKQEIADSYKFRPPGFMFTPSYKNKSWDGWIRLVNPYKGLLYFGLKKHLIRWCKGRGYEVDDQTKRIDDIEFDDDYGQQVAKGIDFPLELYWYQNEYIVEALRQERALIISPTSSGKSAMIRVIQAHHQHVSCARTLILVPTVMLVKQMYDDFISYGCDPDEIHCIKGGVTKDSDRPVVISTWQSVYKLDASWFAQFKCIMGDEAHNFQAKALTSIMLNATSTPFRYGFTGTINEDSKVDKMVLEGLFGPTINIVKTTDLIREGQVAKFKIKGLILNHGKETKNRYKEICKILREKKQGKLIYQAEKDLIINHKGRNEFIRDLVHSMKGSNNLVLFERIEHGELLHKMIKGKEGRTTHLIHGGIDIDIRDALRPLVEGTEKVHDIIASFGVFSTGISIKRLDNLIFAGSYKSMIKTLQSIGRLLRIGGGSDDTVLYDIADNLGTPSDENYFVEHFNKRVDIYQEQGFQMNIKVIDMEKIKKGHMT